MLTLLSHRVYLIIVTACQAAVIPKTKSPDFDHESICRTLSSLSSTLSVSYFPIIYNFHLSILPRMITGQSNFSYEYAYLHCTR